ncbi:EamA family transporter RarD [Sagittula sp. NFXS13]|uniref:EamA family transporter RarD n=1 Tax=Sagittula sp. NFXS13 TaxID=2819095 RepID=UPI0032DF4E94
MSPQFQGILAMIGACTIWGLSPIYYKLLKDVPPLELLAHRTLWSLVVFASILAMQGKLARLRAALGSARAVVVIAFAALMISANWFLFIFSVQQGHVTQTSLGYYMFPLVAVLIGTVVLGEKLKPLQWFAVALAVVAVAQLTIGLGVAPWISLTLAATFGLYGLVKKQLTVGPMVSVTAEVLVLSPIALCWLAVVHGRGDGVFGADLGTSALLMFSGLLTALPLILFSAAAQRVNMVTVGLLQYINPTLQFFCAVVLFGEALNTFQLAAFGLIWTALALYSGQSVAQERARRRSVMTSAAEFPR